MHADGGGLYLQVTNRDAKSWIYRYRLKAKSREMGLGSLHDVTLAEARERALACRRLAREGIDPIEHRRAQRATAALASVGSMTFREAAAAYIEAHQPSWRSEKHAKQWPSSFETYVYPIIGDVSVAAIDTGLILK